MKSWIERALNVHPGDLGRGTLLCSSLFLIITAYKIGGVAAAALFLSRFQARQLAYADIASSVLVAIVVAGYVVIARRVHLRNLVVGSMLFFASNCAVFWVLDHYYSRLLWLFPAFYIWVKIFGVLVPTQILLQDCDAAFRHREPSGGHGVFRLDLRWTGNPHLAQRTGRGCRRK